MVDESEWLYHKDVVAKAEPAFAGLQTRLMCPEYYGALLAHAPYFRAIAAPDESAAVAIRCLADGADRFEYKDGLMLGAYRLHAGRFTVNSLNILGNLGSPAADRLLLNLVVGRPIGRGPLPALAGGLRF